MIWFTVVTFSLKIPLSIFFDKYDKIQLYIGSPFNYLDENPRFYIAITGKFYVNESKELILNWLE